MVANLTPLSTRSRKGRRHRLAGLLEGLEARTLLSSTLYVYGGATDSTHFNTLQAALAAATTGDSILLQPGFLPGSFVTTSLTVAINAGATAIRTAAALDIGDVFSIGNTNGSDPLERDLVTAVTPTGAGDFLLTLATPLQFAHSGSNVSAANASTTGPTIGFNQALTITGDPSLGALPYNLEIWSTATGVTLTNLKLTSGAATNLFIDGNGSSISGLTVSGQVVLNNAQNNTLSNLSVPGRLVVGTGSIGNTLSNSTVAQVRINSGANSNTFTHNTLAAVTAFGIGNSNGHDLFQLNTFTGGVKITGNSSGATSDTFLNNTFTVSSGDALTLENASGTTVQGNTFTDSSAFANALVVHNSGNVVITGNTLTTTGSMGTGVYAYSDVTGSTSVDITNNVIHTTDGWGVYLAKYDTTAPFEARLQGNDLTSNAFGVYIFGDGFTAGTVDLGGDTAAPTRFGASTGGNDFTSFTFADDSHYAIGLFSTTNSYTVEAKNNFFSVADPHTVVADATHTPAAFGSGVLDVTAGVAPPTEVISESTVNLSAIQTGTTSGVIASFTDSLTHSASDFTATINWGDGSTSTGTVVANSSGGFDVQASHQWNSAGSFTFTVTVASAGASASAKGSATITPRVLNTSAVSFSLVAGAASSGLVASFTDNFPGTVAASYTATINWGDGSTSAGTVVANNSGGFDVQASHQWNAAGNFTFTVTISTSGMSGAAQGTAAVAARVLTTSATSISLIAGMSSSGTVATFTDNLAGTTAAAYSATIDWGDGSTSAGTVVANGSGGFVVQAGHQWLTAGNFNFTVSINASGVSGAAQGTASVAPRTLTSTGVSLSLVAGASFSGLVASFTDNLGGTSASDYTATINWGDGTTSAGTVVANNSGGFSVQGAHQWTTAGNLPFTVTISAAGVSTVVNDTVAVAPRVLSASGVSFTIMKGNAFTGTVASFTDNLAGTAASAYAATITWSDGLTTSRIIAKNADGSFAVSTSRSFSTAGIVQATVSISTLDGLGSTTAGVIATVTNPNNKTPPGKDKNPQAPATPKALATFAGAAAAKTAGPLVSAHTTGSHGSPHAPSNHNGGVATLLSGKLGK